MEAFRTTAAPALGRMLLSVVFVGGGLSKVIAPTATKAQIAAAGTPMPELSFFAAVAIELIAGGALLIGFQTRTAAALLALFTLAACVFFRSNLADPVEVTMLLKNISIIGGLLLVLAHGPGPFSIDSRGSARVGNPG